MNYQIDTTIGQATNCYPNWYQWPTTNKCPNCGYCTHCGRADDTPKVTQVTC